MGVPRVGRACCCWGGVSEEHIGAGDGDEPFATEAEGDLFAGGALLGFGSWGAHIGGHGCGGGGGGGGVGGGIEEE